MLYHKYISDAVQYCVQCLLAILLVVGVAIPAHADMLGMESSSDKKESNVPDTIETLLTELLDAIPAGHNIPSKAALQEMLTYAAAEKSPKKVIPARRPHGQGAFVKQTLQVPLKDVLQYCFNPAIPGEAVYPSTIRMSHWTPQSEIVTRKVKLWEQLDMSAASAPIVLRGQEFEEITPDTFSNCYYNYTLDRLLILTNLDGRNVLISASRQAGPSTVGKVGAILGKDEEWNYLYSKEVGSNLTLARWAETYMYDSANVTFFYESSPKSATTEMVFFKFVRAGWSNMNMVKGVHIYEGSQRYLNGLRQILESPTRPSADLIAAKYQEYKNMQSEQLRTALAPFSTALVPWAEKKSDISSKNFKTVLGNEEYVPTLSSQQMGSELLKQFLKKNLKKPLLATHQ